MKLTVTVFALHLAGGYWQLPPSRDLWRSYPASAKLDSLQSTGLPVDHLKAWRSTVPLGTLSPFSPLSRSFQILWSGESQGWGWNIFRILPALPPPTPPHPPSSPPPLPPPTTTPSSLFPSSPFPSSSFLSSWPPPPSPPPPTSLSHLPPSPPSSTSSSRLQLLVGCWRGEGRGKWLVAETGEDRRPGSHGSSQVPEHVDSNPVHIICSIIIKWAKSRASLTKLCERKSWCFNYSYREQVHSCLLISHL